MSRSLLLAAALVVAAPAALAQHQQPIQRPNIDSMRMHQDEMERQAQNNRLEFQRGDEQAWLNSMTNVTKLRTKLAEAWQSMGLSPQQAKQVAAAYDPSQMHHASLRGKSDQEVAQMMQAALKEQHYASANQLLIDYQREKLRLADSAATPKESN